MWMQLASRAFSTAGANKGLKDNESQSMVQKPSVAMPGSSDDDDADGSESVHLSNPSMNELMRTITTANQRPIVISEPRTLTERQRRSLSNPYLLEEPEHDQLVFVRMVGALQERSLKCYPHFDVTPNYMPRTLSLGDLHVDDDNGVLLQQEGFSPGPLMWRAHSEGALITMPGDGNLAQQMAILKPAYDEILMQSQAGAVMTGQTCRRSHRKKRNTHTDTTDRAAPVSPEPHLTTFTSKELQVTPVAATHRDGVCYWISLAHLLVVVACLRGCL